MWPKTVRKSDIRIDYYRGSGAGGQNRNKRDTACRMTHLPTGIAVTAEDERTQGRNKVLAFRRLCDKLVPLMKAQEKPHEVKTERIRTYHQIRNQVKDHRTGKTGKFDKVLEGDIDCLV